MNICSVLFLVMIGIGAGFVQRVSGFGLGIFAIIFIISRIISISSLSGTLAVVITSMIFSDLSSGFIGFIQVVLHIIPCALIFIKHKDNILRLVRGEEKKLTVKKGKSK